MKTLVTGFGPFDVFSFNPSELVAKRLSSRGPDIESIVLPVEYGKARKTLLEALEREAPDLVLSFGLNGTIGHIAVEEMALNLQASEVADNSGRIVNDMPVSENGPLALRTLLPALGLVNMLRSNGIPARRSYSAGVYICNEVFYTGLEWAEKNGSVSGFIHVPMATEMISSDPRSYRIPHMSMEDLYRAGDLILGKLISG